jgi:hypothetical protein
VIACAFGEDMLPSLLPILKSCFETAGDTDDAWHARECGILALGVIAEGAGEFMFEYLGMIAPFLVSELRDPRVWFGLCSRQVVVCHPLLVLFCRSHWFAAQRVGRLAATQVSLHLMKICWVQYWMACSQLAWTTRKRLVDVCVRARHC